MLCHISRQDQSGNKFFNFGGIFHSIQKIDIFSFEKSEESFDMHFFKNGLFVCLF